LQDSEFEPILSDQPTDQPAAQPNPTEPTASHSATAQEAVPSEPAEPRKSRQQALRDSLPEALREQLQKEAEQGDAALIDKQSERAPAPTSDGTQERGSMSATLLENIAPFIIWLSLASVVGSVIYTIFIGAATGVAWTMLSGGVLAIVLLLIGGALTQSFSPVLLAGLMLYRAKGHKQNEAIELAGRDILQPLGLAEDILNVDVDARLVSTRDGVVVYANDAYQSLTKEAGIIGASGLPPRLDRLFATAGPESRKIFHLFRAAKSGLRAEEIITQMMGADQARLRRFEISVRPMRDRGEHMAWRLREIEVEDADNKLAEAYRSYPRPVLALERSGQISWYNEALAEWIGTITDNLAISDFILGETDELVEGLWEEMGEPIEARMRRRKGGGMNVTLTPFTKGGVGEGFVIVELQPQENAVQEDIALSGDMTDAPIGVAMVEGDIGSDAILKEANKMFSSLFELTESATPLSACFEEKIIRELTAAIRSRASTSPLSRPVEVKLGEGASAQTIHLFARPVKRRRGSYGKRQTVLYSVDVSFQKRMEEDYSQDQKLKQVGHLAGSIAHDFNNLLQVIMGSCEWLMRRHNVGDPSYSELVMIQEHSQRAKTLTRNLLAFSRKQTLQSEILSITELLQDFSPFLNRSITERVQLDLVHGRSLPPVKADKGQLELAIMNLAVNARDAMPDGGKLKIETKFIAADDLAPYGYTALDVMDYVLIEVSDSGTGVPPDIAEQIFEPFFTTKGEGKGTGLGLSTVYGVIGQMGGRIFLDNRPGEGATFRIFLPAYEVTEEDRALEERQQKDTPAEPADLTGKGRILIVEDESGVRSIIVKTLQGCGYDITEASDGDEALEMIEDSQEKFDLVLSDIMMPEMDGPTLIQEAGEQLGGAKVIFMSGYAEGAMRDKLDMIEGSAYLQKPFTMKTVAAKVKEALAIS
ncbi:MAG: ATP-binding protein, partial [bacterium]